MTGLSTSAEFVAFRNEVIALAPMLPSSEARIEETLETALGEATQTLRLIDRARPDAGARLLEVGSGLGLASLFLSRVEFDVISVEPAEIGFSWHTEAASVLYDQLGGQHRHVVGRADELPSDVGLFDLVFSNNVVEHIDNPFDTLDSLLGALAPGGRMWHSCPNYLFPYEPHFGVPLVPVRPDLSSKLLPARIVGSDLWASLNFITVPQLRRWATGRNLELCFEQGQLAGSIVRLTTDDQFAGRHPQLTRVARVLVATGVTNALEQLPPALSTPMEFCISQP